MKSRKKKLQELESHQIWRDRMMYDIRMLLMEFEHQERLKINKFRNSMVQIDIKELRYGMWIEYNGHPNMVLGFSTPTPQKDLRFDGKWIVAINPPDYFNVPLEDIKPLKLTREMLEKVGFEQYEGFAEYHRTINIASGVMLLEYNLEDGSLFIEDRVINVGYFHELQNIIYDLSNNKEDISL